ncbi:Heterokaryon incompatibility protein [Paramyrothecium foliicola]|nr:Heterokaryon incompatibility protein [Paramyrothecium foliicola]
MASFRRRILISEAIFAITFWLLAFTAPYLLSFKMRETLGEIADNVPFDLSLLVSAFTRWFDLYIMNFHHDLLLGLSLEFNWFTPLVVPQFIPIAVRVFADYCMSLKVHSRKAELLRLVRTQGIFRYLQGRDFPKLYDNLERHGAGSSPYKYRHLQHPRAIRILRLDPSEKDTAPLVGSLEEEVLDGCSDFKALSYAWDDEKGDGHIICGGSALRVSKNCAAALRRIRIAAGNQSTRLWVDAVCINQTALKEKERQLAIMGEIYKKADKVIVWLGEHDKSSARVLKFFEAVANSRKTERKRSETAKETLLMVRRWYLMSEALARFFNRSWFTRMWPIQEVTLPRRDRVYILCGPTEMPFEHLRFGWDVLKVLGILPTAVNLDQSVALQFYIADALALKRNEVRVASTEFDAPLITDLSQFSLSGVMNATRYKGCKYPKDKFFALYGVFQELGISFDIDPSMYHSHSDVDIMKVIMLRCLQHDGNLDALRLCQLADPYLSSDDFVRTRQDPYDSFSTAVLGMTRRLGRGLVNAYRTREIDYIPATEWRAALPTWVPDWTQWTSRSLDPARDIRFLHSYSSVFVQVSEPTVHLIPQRPEFSAGNTACALCTGLECPGATAHYKISGSTLTVDVRILGSVTDLGSVDSMAVIWQVLAPMSSPSLPLSTGSTMQWIRDFGQRYPDPPLAALIETMINFVWKSRMAQVFISLRMALRTLSLVDLISYICALGGILGTGPWAKELICMRHFSIASCPTDGFTMRKESKRSYLAEVHFIGNMANNFINGRKPWNSDMWFELTGTILATLSYILWDCRVSISESLFGGTYNEMDWWILAPIYTYIMAALMQTVAGGIGDTVFVLLAQSVTALSGIWGLVVFLIWAKMITIPVLVIFGVRACFRSPLRLLGGMFGSEEFRPGDAYTPGMHFFSTEGGATGNTTGPVQEKDLLVTIRGCHDYAIVRKRNNGFVIIGMDHLPKPLQPFKPLRVSYSAGLPYCGPFENFLDRHGWEGPDSLRLSANRTADEVARVVQSWAFFGLLHDFLESAGILSRLGVEAILDDFICDEQGHCSEEPEALVDGWEEAEVLRWTEPGCTQPPKSYWKAVKKSAVEGKFVTTKRLWWNLDAAITNLRKRPAQEVDQALKRLERTLAVTYRVVLSIEQNFPPDIVHSHNESSEVAHLETHFLAVTLSVHALRHALTQAKLALQNKNGGGEVVLGSILLARWMTRQAKTVYSSRQAKRVDDTRKLPENDINFSIWMDTFCVPLEATTRKIAIRAMKEVYQQATRVIAFDSFLQQSRLQGTSYLEQGYKVLCCNWQRRLWTLQEAMYAAKLTFPFSDGLLFFENFPSMVELRKVQRHSTDLSTLQMRDLLDYFCPSSYRAESLNTERINQTARVDRFIGTVTQLCHRTTSRRSDEAVCLATLLDANLEAILEENEPNRIQRILEHQGGFAPTIIFLHGPKMQSEPYRWAPSSFMYPWNSIQRQLFRPTPIKLPGTELKTMRLATLIPQGLLIDLPGIMLCAPDQGAVSGTQFFVLDMSSNSRRLLFMEAVPEDGSDSLGTPPTITFEKEGNVDSGNVVEKDREPEVTHVILIANFLGVPMAGYEELTQHRTIGLLVSHVQQTAGNINGQRTMILQGRCEHRVNILEVDKNPDLLEKYGRRIVDDNGLTKGFDIGDKVLRGIVVEDRLLKMCIR